METKPYKCNKIRVCAWISWRVYILVLFLRHLLDVHPFRSRDLSADSKVMAIKYSMLKGSSHRHIAITDSILKACVCGTVEKDVNKWNLCKIYRRKIICQGIL